MNYKHILHAQTIDTDFERVVVTQRKVRYVNMYFAFNQIMSVSTVK